MTLMESSKLPCFTNAIFEIISPNDLYLFKENREYVLIQHRNFPDCHVELYYPEYEYDY